MPPSTLSLFGPNLGPCLEIWAQARELQPEPDPYFDHLRREQIKLILEFCMQFASEKYDLSEFVG